MTENQEVIDITPKPSLKSRVKNAFANNKVRIGIAIAITAVVSACLARSEMFSTSDSSTQDFIDVMPDMEIPEFSTELG
jgi:hypothetical protein